MTVYGDDSSPARVVLPVTGGTVNSYPFTVPRGKLSMTIHVPAMTGTGATVKLQAMFPRADDQVAESWADVVVFNLADGTFVTLDGLVESTTVTLPIAATGGGVMRFVASEAQASAITIGVTFI
jgi:hypothetical protein